MQIFADHTVTIILIGATRKNQLLSIFYNSMFTKKLFRTMVTGTVLSNILLKHLCRQNPPYIAVSELRC